MPENPKLTVLGAGSWGTALAALTARNGVPTTLWGRDREALAALAASRCNQRYLPDIELPAELACESDLARAVRGADIVLIAPSNPVVSVGAILAVPGIRGALRTTAAKVVGLSPVIGGKPLRGMADECLEVIGVETTSEAIGRHYGARSINGILDGWLVDEGDTADIDGVDVRSIPLLMTSPEETAKMVRTAFEIAGVEL